MTNIPSIEKLKGRENFDTWKLAAKSYLVLKGLWDCFKIESPNEKQLEADLKARSELVLLIEPVNYSYVASKETAKGAWDSLVNAFEDSGNGRKVFLLQQLVSLKLNDCTSTEDYVNRMSVLAMKVRKAGLDVKDDIVGSLMLGGLPSEYKPMVIGLENSGKAITEDYVKNILLQEIMPEKYDGENALAVKSKKKSLRKNKKVRCYECGENHYRRDCPKLVEKSKPKELKCMLTSFLVDEKHNDWYIDSGASAHMTRDRSLLKNVRVSSKKSVVVANNHSIKIECMGDIEQKADDDSVLIIKDVQYIPELCTNLLSVSQIVKHDNKVVFTKDGCKIFDRNGQVISTGKLENNMFKLDFTISQGDSVFSAKVNDFWLWHRRFGHAGIAKINSVLDTKNKVKKLDCEICCKGKQTTKSFTDEGTRANEVLDRIHTDVCGPMSVRSIGGARYYVSFIDDRSRKVFVYVIKSKGEVFDKFIEFKKYVEKQLDRQIKVLRSDNGTEYLNKNFEQFCGAHGIKHEKSAPYSPQQNGLAERMNRTIFEKVRCMLFEAGLSKGFWAEAVCAAVDIIADSIERKFVT